MRISNEIIDKKKAEEKNRTEDLKSRYRGV